MIFLRGRFPSRSSQRARPEASMPSKPKTLAGILRSRRHADREYNRARRDPVIARIHGSARWQAVRAQVLRDEVCVPSSQVPRTPGAGMMSAGGRHGGSSERAGEPGPTDAGATRGGAAHGDRRGRDALAGVWPEPRGVLPGGRHRDGHAGALGPPARGRPGPEGKGARARGGRRPRACRSGPLRGGARPP